MNENSKNEILYRIGVKTDYDDVLHFLRKHYYPEEPLTIGNEPKHQCTEDENFSLSLIEEGVSIVALDQNKKIVGCLMAGSIGEDEAEKLLEESKEMESKSKKWSEILRLLTYLEERSDVCKRYKVNKALYIHAMGVDKQMRGKSIGKNIMKKCFEEAKSLGYPLVSLDCTSVYSIQIAEKLQMDCVGTLAYADYKDCNGDKQLFNPPSPHTHIKTFAKLL